MFGFIFNNSRRGSDETLAIKQQLEQVQQDAKQRSKAYQDAIAELERDGNETAAKLDGLETTVSTLADSVAKLSASVSQMYAALSEAAAIFSNVADPVLDQTPPVPVEVGTEPLGDVNRGVTEDRAGPESSNELSFTVPYVPGYVYAGAVIDRTDVPIAHTSYLPEGSQWEVLRVDGTRVFYRSLD